MKKKDIKKIVYMSAISFLSKYLSNSCNSSSIYDCNFNNFKMLKKISLFSITFFSIIMSYKDKEKNLSKSTIYKRFEKKS